MMFIKNLYMYLYSWKQTINIVWLLLYCMYNLLSFLLLRNNKKNLNVNKHVYANLNKDTYKIWVSTLPHNFKQRFYVKYI